MRSRCIRTLFALLAALAVAVCALTRVDPETPELMLPQALPAQPAA